MRASPLAVTVGGSPATAADVRTGGGVPAAAPGDTSPIAIPTARKTRSGRRIRRPPGDSRHSVTPRVRRRPSPRDQLLLDAAQFQMCRPFCDDNVLVLVALSA